MAKVLRTKSHPDFSTKGVPLTKEEADQDLIEIWNRADSLYDQTADADVNSISVNGTNLFPDNDPQDLGIGDDVEFESLDINGNEFVDSSRNVTANTVLIDGAGIESFTLRNSSTSSYSNTILFDEENSNGTRIRTFGTFGHDNSSNGSENWTAWTLLEGGADPISEVNGFRWGYWDGSQYVFPFEVNTNNNVTVNNTLTINSQQLFTLGEEQALGTGDDVTFNSVTFGSTQVTETHVGNFNTAFADRIDTITYDDPTQVFTFSRPNHLSGDINIDITHDFGNHSGAQLTQTNNYFVYWNGINEQWESKEIDLGITVGNISDSQVPSSAVTQHQGDLSIDENQINPDGSLPYDNYASWSVKDSGTNFTVIGSGDDLLINGGSGIDVTVSTDTVTIDSVVSFTLGELDQVSSGVDSATSNEVLYWNGVNDQWEAKAFTISVFGRTGAVTAESGDYDFSLISGSIGTGQVPETAVTQYEGDLSIAGSQLTGSLPTGYVGSGALSNDVILGHTTVSSVAGTDKVMIIDDSESLDPLRKATVDQLATYIGSVDELNDLSDVTLSTLAEGQILRYDDIGEDRWENVLLSDEVYSIVATMVTGNTETGITVTYQSGDNTLDFVLDSNVVIDTDTITFVGDVTGSDDIGNDISLSLGNNTVGSNEITNDVVLGNSDIPSVAGTDKILIVDDSESLDPLRKATVDQLASYIGSGGATTLDGLDDVEASSPSNGDIIQFGINNEWNAVPFGDYVPASGGTFTGDVTIDGDGSDAYLTVDSGGNSEEGIKFARNGTIDSRIYVDTGENLVYHANESGLSGREHQFYLNGTLKYQIGETVQTFYGRYYDFNHDGNSVLNIRFNGGTYDFDGIRFQSTDEAGAYYDFMQMTSGKSQSDTEDARLTFLNVNEIRFNVDTFNLNATLDAQGGTFSNDLTVNAQAKFARNNHQILIEDTANSKQWSLTTVSDQNIGFYEDASTNRWELDTSGNVTATDFIATSDARIKENESPITNALESLRNITPYHFDKDGERKVGYIAQNVEGFTENVVTQIEKDGYKDFRVMNLFGMQAYNTQAIKEVDDEVTQLKNRVQELEEEVRQLGGSV